MSRFSIRHPYLIVVICIIACIIGVTSALRMPVDLFPPIQIPVVTCATFYAGMPPAQIEAQITNTFERFFTLGANIDHIESRSLPGVSLIRVYFTPGSSANADVTEISNLAMADLRRLPPGTLPPVVLRTSASFLPVCMIAVTGKGLTVTQLRDNLQYEIRDQIAGVKGATVPPPFGGKYRMEMVYVDPHKLQAYGLSPMDVVDKVNSSNVILPAGDVRIGPLDYDVYTNSMVPDAEHLNQVVLKTLGHDKNVYVGDVGHAVDGSWLQYNIVRIDGQQSTYVGVMTQGGNTSIIDVVNGIREAVRHLRDIPKQMKAMLVFDQSVFVRQALRTVANEGGMGLALTGLMILVFLGSFRATAAVFLAIPLSVLTAMIFLNMTGSTVNALLLSGLALAFSRLIDNSVIVLENIYRHLEEGEAVTDASEAGAAEVGTAVLAITLATCVVFFPVVLLNGVSKYLFTALAMGVVFSLIASYFVALAVVPLYCSRMLKPVAKEDAASEEPAKKGLFAQRFRRAFNTRFDRFLNGYDRWVSKALDRPWTTVIGFVAIFALSLIFYPFLGRSFFPRVDAGQFMINVKAPTGSRLSVTDDYVKQVEGIIRQTVGSRDLKTIVSNIGLSPGFESLFSPNAAMYTGFIEVGLNTSHKISSFEYSDRVQARVSRELPELRTYFHSGSLVSSVLDQGVPAPIDIQISGRHLQDDMSVARSIASQIRALPSIQGVYIPQGVDYPSLKVNLDRTRVSELGLTPKQVVDSVITALTSNQMIAPGYWVSPRGNQYFVSVQYPNNTVRAISDLQTIPLRDPKAAQPTYLEQVASVQRMQAPTEVDHYQLEREIDVYVEPRGQDLSRPYKAIQKIVAQTHLPSTDVRVDIRGLVITMQNSFKSFALGLLLAIVLVYLILVAQFKSFTDPFLILLAIPTGLTGVLLILFLTGTTVNIQSLMGVLMMMGMVVSNTILIVDFAKRLQQQGRPVREAVAYACRIRLRPILMTSLATVVGLVPMALKLEPGAGAYSPLALSIIGGVTASVLLSIFVIPAAYLLVYGRREAKQQTA